MKYHVIGLIVKNRLVSSIELQKVLSKHGHLIKTRLGIHETKKEEDHGLVILHVEGNEEQLNELIKELKSIPGISANMMCIEE